MSSIVMTIHTFDHSYAGLSASEIQSSSCRHIFLSARRAGKFVHKRDGNPAASNFMKQYRDMWQDAEIAGEIVAICRYSSARIFAHGKSIPISISTR